MKPANDLRRAMADWLVVLSFCVAANPLAAALAGELPGEWRFWRYSRAISLTATDQPRLVSVVPPLEVIARARPGLDDLRVIDDQAREVPYVIFARTGSTSRQNRSARLLENSFTPGEFTQVILDLGERPPFHNAVTIEARESDFIIWVEVAVSDDARAHWRIVRPRAGIFRLHKQSLEGNQTISYSDSNARYVRLRFLEGARQFGVAGAQVAYDFAEPPDRAVVSVALVAVADARSPGSSVWRADLGTPNLPIAEVRFEVDQPEFNRNVKIAASADGENWRYESSGKIYRVRQKDQVEESLSASVQEVHGMPYWRVSIENGNDPPLAGVRPALFTTPRHIVFRQEPGRSYRLLYGQSEARPPQYELGRLAPRKEMESAAPGSLQNEEVNANYADPRPWTEQHPSVLWAALGAAVVLIAYSALRALRST